MHNKLVHLGVILGAHGINGNVVIKSFTAQKNNIVKLPIQMQNGKIISIKLLHAKSDGNLVCSLEGVHDRNAAEALNGKYLYCNRADLPELNETEYYFEDICGLDVHDTSGNKIGIVLAMHNFGAGDIVEVKFQNNITEMYPFSKDMFPTISHSHIVLNI